MGTSTKMRPRVEMALGAILADGFFCLAFILHLKTSSAGSLTLFDFLWMGVILSVFFSSCWLIYDDYWEEQRELQGRLVKTLRIKEMKQGAAVHFDGKHYRVENINRARGEILLARVGQPGTIVVQIESSS